jgi:hypothetical protein
MIMECSSLAGNASGEHPSYAQFWKEAKYASP